jgi:hypothetical protein
MQLIKLTFENDTYIFVPATSERDLPWYHGKYISFGLVDEHDDLRVVKVDEVWLNGHSLPTASPDEDEGLECLFNITIAGRGKDVEECWQDAFDGFVEDPGNALDGLICISGTPSEEEDDE